MKNVYFCVKTHRNNFFMSKKYHENADVEYTNRILKQ